MPIRHGRYQCPVPVRTPEIVSCLRSTKPRCPEHRILLGVGFSAILLQLLAVRPVHEYNISMGGDTPQVTVLSQVAIPDQRHDGITSWHSSQVEGLVAFTGSAGSSPVSGTLQQKDLRRPAVSPFLLPGSSDRQPSPSGRSPHHHKPRGRTPVTSLTYVCVAPECARKTLPGGHPGSVLGDGRERPGRRAGATGVSDRDAPPATVQERLLPRR